MAVGLFWNDKVSFDRHDYDKKFFWVGNNTGNLVFIRALKNILDPVIFPLWDIDNDRFRDREDISAYVTTELIWLTEGTTYPHVWKMLDRIGGKPLVPISVGIHAGGKADVALHPDTVRLLRAISERAVLGVRGEYTAGVLEKKGIINLKLIGCPSMYYGMNEGFRVDKRPFDWNMKPVVNFRTFYGRLEPWECEFLTWAANRDLPFVEQTKQMLTLDICQQNRPQFEYLNAWLERRREVFFDVEAWAKWIGQYDFSLGSRFHGNMLAILSGVPALTMVVDSRMNEMTRLFRLPTLPMHEYRMDRPLSEYYDMADFTEFNRVYPERLRSFRDFLHRNGLKEAVR